MAITDIVVSGKLYQDDGDAVSGATVALLETGTSTSEATTTTDSNGAWTFTETSLDTTYDIKITSGTSVRYILWSDEITTKGVDTASLKVRGVEGAAAPIYLFADQADNAGDGWRIQASASDTLAIGSDKASAGTIIDYLTITNGASAAASVAAFGGDLTVGDDLSLTSDSAVFNMGAGNDFTITHDGTTGATIAGNPVTITASGASTWSTSSGALTITSAAALNLNPAGGSAILLDGTISVDAGVVTGATAITSQTIDATTDFTIGDTVITDGVITDSSGLSIAAAVDLGANTLTSTGSMQIRTIDYSDGDVAITIADGGGITAAAGITSTAAANALGASSFAGDVAVADSKFIEFESAAGTPTTDNTVQGIVIEFLAVEAITQFDAVYVSTTTGRVGRADANLAAKMPVIGIAIEAQGSAGSSVRVLTHGVYRDDGGFGGNMTVGVDLYAPETPGTLTTTRPSDDGDLIQVIGVATGVRSAYINPSLDIIEHA